jgi:hypothetical protein
LICGAVFWDLTANDLVNIKNIDCLNNLTTLNLAYNQHFSIQDNIALIKLLLNLKYLVLIGTAIDKAALETIKVNNPTLNLVVSPTEYEDFLKKMYGKKK